MRRTAIAAMVTAAALLAGGPARGTGPIVAAGPGAYLFVGTYTTPVAAAQVGGELTFVNGDIALHDVVARDDFAPAQCPTEPGICGEDVPEWCLPPKPDEPWTTSLLNPLPFAAGKCPLFATPLIGTAVTAPVEGLWFLEAGRTYRFYCTLHPWMLGTLVALPAGP